SVSLPPIPAQSGARTYWQRRRCDKATDRSSGGGYFSRFALSRQLGMRKNDEARMTKDRSASCVLVRASRHQSLPKDCFGETPKPAGETRALPKRRYDTTYGR